MTDFHKPGQPGQAAALLLAVELLAAPIKDRPREFQPFLDHILLLDDSGGECVTSFDDATAVHYFLKWLHEERAIKALLDKCEDRIANKIAARTLCKQNQGSLQDSDCKVR